MSGSEETPALIPEDETSKALADLQSRLSDLELNKTHTDIAEALRNERIEMLLSLRKIMEAMEAEASAGGKGGAVVGGAEMEALKAENEELKKINAKQEYRIRHLVHNLREALEAKEKQ